MPSKKPAPLSAAMHRYLANVDAGRPVSTGIHGQAAHGGLEGTHMALLRRGYIQHDREAGAWTITPEGAQALATANQKAGLR